MIANVKEVAARGARVTSFVSGKEPAHLSEISSDVFHLPELAPSIAPIAMATALHWNVGLGLSLGMLLGLAVGSTIEKESDDD
jgi:glucosamine 6-phosphate synthetase-like amidotransferase/phosphosugar isomerase protein